MLVLNVKIENRGLLFYSTCFDEFIPDVRIKSAGEGI
jgi:hypothetical protein